MTLGDIWRRTRHNNMPILLATVACSLPFWIVGVGGLLAGSVRSLTSDMLGEAASMAALWLCSWVYASFLLTAYRHLFAGPESSL